MDRLCQDLQEENVCLYRLMFLHIQDLKLDPQVF